MKSYNLGQLPFQVAEATRRDMMNNVNQWAGGRPNVPQCNNYQPQDQWDSQGRPNAPRRNQPRDQWDPQGRPNAPHRNQPCDNQGQWNAPQGQWNAPRRAPVVVEEVQDDHLANQFAIMRIDEMPHALEPQKEEPQEEVFQYEESQEEVFQE